MCSTRCHAPKWHQSVSETSWKASIQAQTYNITRFAQFKHHRVNPVLYILCKSTLSLGPTFTSRHPFPPHALVSWTLNSSGLDDWLFTRGPVSSSPVKPVCGLTEARGLPDRLFIGRVTLASHSHSTSCPSLSTCKK